MVSSKTCLLPSACEVGYGTGDVMQLLQPPEPTVQIWRTPTQSGRMLVCCLLQISSQLVCPFLITWLPGAENPAAATCQ